ncbi:MAG: hypothetical protein GY764_10455, partial [Halieaceae bacterium]|nr:hypothetical protein [Halieaceae bacterium]
LYNHFGKLFADPWSSTLIRRRLCPFPPHKFPAPADGRLRLEDANHPLELAGCQPTSLLQRRCHHGRRPFILSARSDYVILFASEHIELMAEYEDIEVFIIAGEMGAIRRRSMRVASNCARREKIMQTLS